MDLNSEILLRTTDSVTGSTSVENLLQSKRQLRIKYGVDVTAPFLHLGHAVNLWYMRKLQDAGHKVVFLIGDFTTRIGDPTGKSKTRPIIPQEEITKNSEAFIDQISNIVLTDPEVFEVRRNSEWFDKMAMGDFFNLLSQVSHSHLMQRDMFQKRIADGTEIRMHEMLYPILQGYDSYMLDADLTVVGSDQLFNEMMGRFFQEKHGQRAQTIITTTITPGLDGKNKQSKSLNNYIAITDEPREKFGKVMSIPDELIIPYMQTYTEMSNAEIAEHEQSMKSGSNPSLSKKALGAKVVERYHGAEIAQQELKFFENAFSKKKAALEDLPELKISRDELMKLNGLSLLKKVKEKMSNSDIRRLFEQGAVSLNDTKLGNSQDPLAVNSDDVLKVGKKEFFKIKIEDTPSTL